jgi:hypothetical protein
MEIVTIAHSIQVNDRLSNRTFKVYKVHDTAVDVQTQKIFDTIYKTLYML